MAEYKIEIPSEEWDYIVVRLKYLIDGRPLGAWDPCIHFHAFIAQHGGKYIEGRNRHGGNYTGVVFDEDDYIVFKLKI